MKLDKISRVDIFLLGFITGFSVCMITLVITKVIA